MRNQVFISYRHESSEHSRAVRRLGDTLRLAKIPVVLDQFLLEDRPGGPDESWPKWCEDCANESACVLIIASEGWFAAYDKTGPAGQGLGAATEADLFRQALWDDKGHNERIRLAFLHDVTAERVPARLRGWHRFHPFDSAGPGELIRWLASRLGVKGAETPGIQWPAPAPFQPDIADRNMKEWPAIVDLLAGCSSHRILLLEGGSGLGKSELVRQAADYARKLEIPLSYVNFKGGAWKLDDVLGQIDVDLGSHLPALSGDASKKPHLLRKDLRALHRPVLFIFDSYEDVAGNQSIADWLNVQLLGDLGNAPAVAVLVAGQKAPEFAHSGWRDLARRLPLLPITDFEHWNEWILRRHPNFHQKGDLKTILKAAEGLPSIIVTLCERIARS